MLGLFHKFKDELISKCQLLGERLKFETVGLGVNRLALRWLRMIYSREDSLIGFLTADARQNSHERHARRQKKEWLSASCRSRVKTCFL